MAKIHLILQGKGGVGKSFVAALLAQYLSSQRRNILCLDTDPVNSTFHGYKALNVRRLNILEGEEINSRNFDAMIESIAGAKDNVIIDNGAASFVPLSHYLVSNDIPPLLKEMGHELIIHTIITGGQAFLDTVNGFNQLIGKFAGKASLIVWLNPYWGSIEHEGKDFENLKVYKENAHHISAIMEIPDLKKETFGRDLSDMLQERLTFDEALAKESLTIMTRQRLKLIREQLFQQLNTTVVLECQTPAMN